MFHVEHRDHSVAGAVADVPRGTWPRAGSRRISGLRAFRLVLSHFSTVARNSFNVLSNLAMSAGPPDASPGSARDTHRNRASLVRLVRTAVRAALERKDMRRARGIGQRGFLRVVAPRFQHRLLGESSELSHAYAAQTRPSLMF